MPENGHVLASKAGTFYLGGDVGVNRLGFGAMRITGEGIWGPPDNPSQAKAVLRRTLELGVNFIDTADAYGPEVSEDLIAEALYPYPADLIIATKGGLTRSGPGQWHPKGDPEYLQTALEGSLKRLKQDCIDLYQYHRPDPEVPFEESVGAIARMREQGKIRFVGLSNVTTEQLKTAQGIVPIVSVQNRYNLFDRASEDVLEMCEREHIAFIPWFPVGAGSLENDTLQQITAKYDATPYQIALAWLLKRSPVMLPIPGTSSVDHLEENVAAAAIELSDEDFNALDKQ
ncbi:MAG: aldo/keto reductase [Anaerolineae bacterium]|nr:aldo/keto reductase [Anaerolineae bacterium]